MIIIPGILIAIVTFPGVIIHELAHQIFCYLCHVPVYEVKYFQFQNPCGYVTHEKPDKLWKTFLISSGPFFINTLLGAILLFPASIEVITFGVSTEFLNIAIFWLGISIVMHAFPSTIDSGILVSEILKNKEVNIFIRILIAPFIGLMYLGAIGSVVWLDLGYAFLIAYLLPTIIAVFI